MDIWGKISPTIFGHINPRPPWRSETSRLVLAEPSSTGTWVLNGWIKNEQKKPRRRYIIHGCSQINGWIAWNIRKWWIVINDSFDVQGSGLAGKGKEEEYHQTEWSGPRCCVCYLSNSISKSPTMRKACSKQLNNKNGAKNRNTWYSWPKFPWPSSWFKDDIPPHFRSLPFVLHG